MTTQQFPRVVLHKHKADAVRRFHPWIFSGAVKSTEGKVSEGDTVEVVDERGTFLALGHYATGSIAVRVFSFLPTTNLPALWRTKIAEAVQARKASGLFNSAHTNCFRLLNAEGDGMPGLILDFYNGTVVMQCHSAGMYRERENFVRALQEVLGDKLKAIFDKSSTSLHSTEKVQDGFLFGEAGTNEVLEHNHRFKVDWQTGQKTGFFLDQRENRKLLADYSHGKKVLNTFCYSGGFSVYALQAGATLVHSVDSSKRAIEWTNENIALNNFSAEQHASFCSDVFDFMKQAETDYDIIILDPPAFAKNHHARHQAVQAYKRLNVAAMQKVKAGGIIFTFSCSQAVGVDLFGGAIHAAAIESGKTVRILHHLTQPADHPVSAFHPEGLYLKGLVLHVC